MLKNQDSGLQNHTFERYDMQNNLAKGPNCQICGEGQDSHPDKDRPDVIDDSNAQLNVTNMENASLMGNAPEHKYRSNKKIEYVKVSPDVAAELDDQNLCQICYDNFILDKDPTKFSINNHRNKGIYLKCRHKFCEDCIVSYLKARISNRDVLEIKCLYGGCPATFDTDEIKRFLNLGDFANYKRIRNEILNQRNPELAHCPVPDCQGFAELPHFEGENMIICELRHEFCFQCKSTRNHDLHSCPGRETMILELLHQKSNNKHRFKSCPQCFVIIEKTEGCNHMQCIVCGHHFCWLCLNEYTEIHYSQYNVMGCPGLRYHNEEEDSYLNSTFFVLLYYFGCAILAIVLMALVLAFFFFVGMPYELIMFYRRRFDLHRDEETNQMVKTEGEPSLFICVILGLIGIPLQPIYLIFYAMMAFVEIIRRCDWWMLYYAAY